MGVGSPLGQFLGTGFGLEAREGSERHPEIVSSNEIKRKIIILKPKHTLNKM